MENKNWKLIKDCGFKFVMTGGSPAIHSDDLGVYHSLIEASKTVYEVKSKTKTADSERFSMHRQLRKPFSDICHKSMVDLAGAKASIRKDKVCGCQELYEEESSFEEPRECSFCSMLTRKSEECLDSDAEQMISVAASGSEIDRSLEAAIESIEELFSAKEERDLAELIAFAPVHHGKTCRL